MGSESGRADYKQLFAREAEKLEAYMLLARLPHFTESFNDFCPKLKSSNCVDFNDFTPSKDVTITWMTHIRDVCRAIGEKGFTSPVSGRDAEELKRYVRLEKDLTTVMSGWAVSRSRKFASRPLGRAGEERNLPADEQQAIAMVLASRDPLHQGGVSVMRLILEAVSDMPPAKAGDRIGTSDTGRRGI